MSVHDFLIREKTDTSTDTEKTTNTLQDLDRMVDEQLAKFNTDFEQETPQVEDVKLETATPAYEFDLEQEEDPAVEEHTEQIVRAGLSLRTKLIAGVVGVALVLLATLLIYNAVVIHGLNSEIAYNTEVLQVEQARLDSLVEQVNSVNGSTPEQLNLRTTSKIRLQDMDKLTGVELTKDSNWFDVICQFFSKAFGG